MRIHRQHDDNVTQLTSTTLRTGRYTGCVVRQGGCYFLVAELRLDDASPYITGIDLFTGVEHRFHGLYVEHHAALEVGEAK